ncbi:Cell division protein FtsY homolog, chloroplastic [Linum grandiflorum]
MMAAPPSQAHPSLLLSNPSRQLVTLRRQTVSIHGRARATRFKCSAATGTGFFSRLGRLIKEKAKSDVEKIVSGFSKTRDNLAVIDELLLYWNLSETDRVLDELEEITIKIVESLREDILAGKLKSGSEIKSRVLDLLVKKGSKTELQLGYRKPAVIMIVGVNGGGKTTSLGK